MHYLIAVLAFLCLFNTSLPAQSLTQQLDHLFETTYSPDSPGASILISNGGQIIYERQFGLANIEHATPVSAASIFSAGSIAKQFTVAALLQLAEQDKLKLSDTLQQHLTGYPFPASPIRLHQLINHTSGLKDYPRIKEVRKILRNEPSVDDLIRLALEAPVDFLPGSDYSYSNTGYLLLGKVIEEVSGRPFEEYVRSQIFVPAGMASSSFTDFFSVLPKRTTPYSFDDDRGIVRAIPHAYSSASGGLMTTSADLNKWVRALLNEKIIGQANLKLMFAPTAQRTAPTYYGWEVNNIAEELSYEYTGYEPGYKASSLYLPKSGFYIVVLQNTDHGSPTPSLLKAAAICLNKPFPVPADEATTDRSVLEKFTGRYVFPGEEERIIQLTEDRLSYQTPGGLPRPLYFQDSLTLFFKDGYRQLHLTPASEGAPAALTYQNRKYRQKGVFVSKNVPTEKKAIEVPEAVLETYVGAYQTEHFLFVIKLEDGQLSGGPGGNDMMPLVPYAEHKFFVPQLGAEIEFEVLPGRPASVKILLEGMHHSGTRL